MIYFIQDEGTFHIKIGYTGGPAAKRLRELQVASPSGLVLLRAVPGDMDCERELHRRFDRYRVHGEWFQPAPALLRLILAGGENYPGDGEASAPVPIPHPGFDELIGREPELAELYRVAKSYRDDQSLDFCANDIWYELLKPRLVKLVGGGRESCDFTLSTTLAYDVAYQTIYDALPHCRGLCPCVQG